MAFVSPFEERTAAGLARTMGTLSRFRGKRIAHPHGVGFAGRLAPAGGEEIGAPALERSADIIVRLSRSAGLPEWLPDPCGLALRIPDAYGARRHQDLLMVSAALPPVARHLILPARGFLDRPYSTLLPYRLRGRLTLIGALPRHAAGAGPRLADLAGRSEADLAFDLAIAGLRGPWRRVAHVSLGERLGDTETERLTMDPANAGGGLEPVGFLNRLRGPSYRASQAGRGARRRASAVHT